MNFIFQNPAYILIPLVVVIGFCILAYGASWTDKVRNKARSRCKMIIEDREGIELSITEKYKATKREFEYNVEWSDKGGNKHHFKYHPPTMDHREKIVED